MLIILPIASAKVSIDVEHSPDTILPGDEVDYTVTLSNKGAYDVKVKEITLYTRLDVDPDSVSNVGTIPTTSSYDFPFTVEAEKAGSYTIEMHVRTQNETIKRLIPFNVENKQPNIILTTPLKLNEVNNLRFYLTNPIGDIEDVTVEPRFDADPKVIYFGDLTSSQKGIFRYTPESREDLSFKISYYNGRNYHQVVKTVTPEYRETKGIIVNASIPYNSVPVQDIVPLDVTISNLRNDTIYSAKVSASLEGSEKTKEIASLGSGEDSKVRFQFSPQNVGENTIQVDITYKDELNNHYSETEEVEFFALEGKSMSVSNIRTDQDTDGTTISGDVSNSGRSTVYNVLLSMQVNNQVKTFYLGSIDTSDFDSFEFEFSDIDASEGVLTVSWNNELGEKVELNQEIDLPEERIGQPAEDGNLMVIGSVIAIAILALVAVIWIKSRK
ncbi:MAG: hypothetical protein R6U44_08995 [Archaeoglobaceae archaeon]